MRLGVRAVLVGDRLVPGDVEVADGRVARVGLAAPGGRGIAAPGFVDLQVNGFAGVDLAGAGPDGWRLAGEALKASGVTAFRPTFVTAAEAELTAALRGVPARLPGGPRVLGAHLEGPFLAPSMLRAHPAAHRRDPDPALLERLLAAGPVGHVTLAPELPGALAAVDDLVARGVTVSLGHSAATAAAARAAFARGARAVTHLFNAMAPITAREPGLAGAALADPAVTVTVIADGRHVAPESLLLAWRAAAGRLALVSDATAAAAAPEGSYALGGQPVLARAGEVRRAEDGVLAGGTGTMAAAVRHLHGLGVPLEAALDAAAGAPARLAGDPGLGALRPGAAADVVVLDDRLEVVRTLVAGT